MLKKMLMVAAVLVLGAAAPAAAQYPGITITPGQVPEGGTVTVTGQGCGPGDTVVITLRPAGSTDGVEVATVITDADGNFNASFVVPANTVPGSYEVVVACSDIIQIETIEILTTTVTSPTTPGTTPGTTPPGNGGTNTPNGSGDLPTTGSDLNGYGLVGAGLLTVGGLFLLGARKRRSAAV